MNASSLTGRSVLAIAALLAPCPTFALEPGEIAGLVAHWSEDTLHRTLRDNEPVRGWPDAGPNGHDLIEARTGLPTMFRTVQVAGRPAVVVGKQSSFTLDKPFTLRDHTIAIVYASSKTHRALLSSREAPMRGIVIHDSNARDYLQGPGGRTNYGIPQARDDGFRVLVLTRRDGQLESFVDGESQATLYFDPAPLPVDRLFAIDHSRAARSDGIGLRIAQLAVFDRALEDDERNALIAAWGKRYGIEVVAGRTPLPEPQRVESVFTWPESKVLLRVGSTSTLDLDRPASSVPWTGATRVRAPLHHDATSAPERIGVLDDATVWLSVLLVAPWREPAPSFRVLLLADGATYLDHEATPTRVERDDGPWLETRLDAELTLEAGSTIEVVVAGEGGGALRLDPASRLLATTERPTIQIVPVGAAAPR